MVRNYKRKSNRGSYGEESLQNALAEMEKGVPLKEAAKRFKIPPKTLRRHRDQKVATPGHIRLGRYRSGLHGDTVFTSNLKTVNKIKPKRELLVFSGVVVVFEELFIANENTSDIVVTNLSADTFIRKFTIEGSDNSPFDLAFCKINGYLYTMATNNWPNGLEIIQSTTDGKKSHSWSTERLYGSISVAFDSNIVMTSDRKNLIVEYTSAGNVVRKIEFSEESDLINPAHAIKLPGDRFLVSHGWRGDILHRVCVIDMNGAVQMSFGGTPGSDNQSLKFPYRMTIDSKGSIIVVDRSNCRLLLLDSKLAFQRVLIDRKEIEEMPEPLHLAIGESTGRLFLVHRHPIDLLDTCLSIFKFG